MMAALKNPRTLSSEEASALGRKNRGKKQNRVRCPRCGDDFGNLPSHLTACDGGNQDE